MEPVGLTVGIIGLAGLFSTCLDVVERWDSYKDFGVESEALVARFEADRALFRRWGQSIGIDRGTQGHGHHEALDDPLFDWQSIRFYEASSTSTVK
ncbi:hypothetical protein F5Y18DRAFT_392257 [Xylariaceae sp. FL1019]|nr:hypothetical protein F5Y18DRAFT_392257 [Xylariaceae sp. FL1019]